MPLLSSRNLSIDLQTHDPMGLDSFDFDPDFQAFAFVMQPFNECQDPVAARGLYSLHTLSVLKL